VDQTAGHGKQRGRPAQTVRVDGSGFSESECAVTSHSADHLRWIFLAERLDGERAPVVIDIGANPLDHPVYKPLLDAGLCELHGFEPQAEAFSRLQEIKGVHETYENRAVGDGGTHEFRIFRQSGLSSFFEIDRSALRFLGRSDGPAKLLDVVEVETMRLDDAGAIDRIDLLKIDVQGAEAMIFENAKKKLASAVAVITELRFFPLYEGEPLLDVQIARLSELGLRFHKLLFVKSQQVANSQSRRLKTRALSSQALDGDAVFVRDLRDPASVTDEQLRALALLADAVFESYDLTIHCLDLLVDRGCLDSEVPVEYVAYLPDQVRRDT
jgi:FkbM family methyltransferase